MKAEVCVSKGSADPPRPLRERDLPLQSTHGRDKVLFVQALILFNAGLAKGDLTISLAFLTIWFPASLTHVRRGVKYDPTLPFTHHFMAHHMLQLVLP